jgi:hypothetical protein
MKALRRLGVSLLLAATLTGGLLLGLLFLAPGREPPRQEEVPERRAREAPAPRPEVEVAAATTPRREIPAEAAPPEAPERPIEEILLEEGEDPGAVYYMSRVREALREGNPGFARELLRQMKEQHGDSVLVTEAEDLFSRSRRRR